MNYSSSTTGELDDDEDLGFGFGSEEATVVRNN